MNNISHILSALDQYTGDMDSLNATTAVFQEELGDNWTELIYKALTDLTPDQKERLDHAFNYYAAVTAWNELQGYLAANVADLDIDEVNERIPVLAHWLSFFGDAGENAVSQLQEKLETESLATTPNLSTEPEQTQPEEQAEWAHEDTSVPQMEDTDNYPIQSPVITLDTPTEPALSSPESDKETIKSDTVFEPNTEAETESTEPTEAPDFSESVTVPIIRDSEPVELPETEPEAETEAAPETGLETAVETNIDIEPVIKAEPDVEPAENIFPPIQPQPTSLEEPAESSTEPELEEPELEEPEQEPEVDETDATDASAPDSNPFLPIDAAQETTEGWLIDRTLRQIDFIHEVQSWVAARSIWLGNLETYAYKYYGFLVDVSRTVLSDIQTILGDKSLFPILESRHKNGLKYLQDTQLYLMQEIKSAEENCEGDVSPLISDTVDKEDLRKALGFIDTSAAPEYMGPAPDGFEALDDPYTEKEPTAVKPTVSEPTVQPIKSHQKQTPSDETLQQKYQQLEKSAANVTPDIAQEIESPVSSQPTQKTASQKPQNSVKGKMSFSFTRKKPVSE